MLSDHDEKPLLWPQKKNILTPYPKKNPYFNHILEYLFSFYDNGIFCESKTTRNIFLKFLTGKILFFLYAVLALAEEQLTHISCCLGADATVIPCKSQQEAYSWKCSLFRLLSLSSLFCSTCVILFSLGARKKFYKND